MDNVGIIEKYFKGLSDLQLQRFAALRDLYLYWNERINLISRQDTDELYTRHVLHSLSIARLCAFDCARVLDVGTGGGFPAVPLAILFPDTEFTAVDSTGKKISALSHISDSLKLDNLTVRNERAETTPGVFDFATGRAVSKLSDFVSWTRGKIGAESRHALPNGIICLKGGNLTDEIRDARKKHALSVSQVVEYQISDYFDEPFFETKKIVYVQV